MILAHTLKLQKIHAVVLWYLPIPWTYHWFHCLSTLYLSCCEDKLGSPSSISSLGRTGALSRKIFPERFFHPNSNWMDISFCSHPSCSEVIAMKFCTWHDSPAIMTCAKFCSNILPYNGVIRKLNSHRILITTEKSLVKWAPRGLVNKLSPDISPGWKLEEGNWCWWYPQSTPFYNIEKLSVD